MLDKQTSKTIGNTSWLERVFSLISTIGLLILGIYYQAEIMKYESPLPGRFPQLILLVMFVFVGIYLTREIIFWFLPKRRISVRAREAIIPLEVGIHDWMRVIIIGLMTVLYSTILIPLGGFYIASFLYLSITSIALSYAELQRRNLLINVCVAIGFNLFVYLTFELLLDQKLP